MRLTLSLNVLWSSIHLWFFQVIFKNDRSPWTYYVILRYSKYELVYKIWLVSPSQVEDLRVIIHNLGKFLSNRDVKVCFSYGFLFLFFWFVDAFPDYIIVSYEQELVQSALLESNTGRDDRILYEKLVKMSGLWNDSFVSYLLYVLSRFVICFYLVITLFTTSFPFYLWRYNG